MTYDYTVQAGLLVRGRVRRALCAAQDADLISAWTEPAKGYFRVTSEHPNVILTVGSDTIRPSR